MPLCTKDRFLCNFEYFRAGPLKERTSPDLRFISENYRAPLEKIFPLQNEGSKKNLWEAKVVCIEDKDGKKFKVRWCRDEDEARKIYSRAQFAYASGVPTARPLTLCRETILLEYINGKDCLGSFSRNDVSFVGEIHANMNSSVLHNFSLTNSFLEEMCRFISEGSRALYDGSIFNSQTVKKLERLPNPQVIIVFDHDDIGRHNYLDTLAGRKMLLDEEAFGYLPFGFGLVRPLYDVSLKIVKDREELQLYLNKFPKFP